MLYLNSVSNARSFAAIFPKRGSYTKYYGSLFSMKNVSLSFVWLFLPTYNSVAAENVLINCIASITFFITRKKRASTRN